MAIEKMIFTGTNQDQNFPEVYAWLTANAAEYFDEITQDETAKTITCKIGGQNAFTLYFASDKNVFQITLKNGITRTTADTGKSIDFAVKTSKGIYLKYKGVFVNIFITRDDRGAVSFAGLSKNSNGYRYLFSGSFSNSPNFWESSWHDNGGTDISPSAYDITMASSLTSMCAMPCNGQVYTPDLYFVPFTENFGRNSKISCNGTEYYYDGIFALKD